MKYDYIFFICYIFSHFYFVNLCEPSRFQIRTKVVLSVRCCRRRSSPLASHFAWGTIGQQWNAKCGKKNENQCKICLATHNTKQQAVPRFCHRVLLQGVRKGDELHMQMHIL